MYHSCTEHGRQLDGGYNFCLAKKSVTRSFKKQLARSGLEVYIQVRLLFQRQTGHLPLLVHGTEPTTESTGKPTFCKTATETRASSSRTWLERKSRSLITCLQEHNSLISTDFRLRDLPNVGCPTCFWFTPSFNLWLQPVILLTKPCYLLWVGPTAPECKDVWQAAPFTHWEKLMGSRDAKLKGH